VIGGHGQLVRHCLPLAETCSRTPSLLGSGGEGVTSRPEPQTTAAHCSGHYQARRPAGWRWPSWAG
jgi:hypothetical protein